ncbi:MAG: protein translocase subunit SecD [Alphaproteobacteria bacterium]|nr:protein translocase subunit SecD [Alphaproteobacteria bacterium]
MEGSYWVRLGTIVLLTLGCVYVLAPSFLLDDAIDTSAFEGAAKVEPALQAWFVADDKFADTSTAAAVEQRLVAAGVPIEGVQVKRVLAGEGEQLVVTVRTGTDPKQVDAVVAAEPAPLAVYGADAFGVDETTLDGVDDLPGVLAKALRGASASAEASPVVDGAPGLAVTDGGVTLTFDAAPPGLAVLTVGGEVVGWVRSAASGTPVSLTVVDPDTLAKAAVASAGPLPERLTAYEAPEVDPAAEVVDTTPKDIPWWEEMLPTSYKLNRGLDLQGGIDMTLQVDQDAAVDALVTRDRRRLADQAVKDGKTVSVRKDRVRFALRVASPDFDTLSDWVSAQLGAQYVYADTIEDEGERWMIWEMDERQVAQIKDQAVEQNLETLRKRIDATGVKEPSIVKMGGGRINIQLPGLTDPQSAIDAIGTQAILEFKMVDEDVDRNNLVRVIGQAEKALPPSQFDDLDTLNEWLHRQGLVPEGRVVQFHYEEGPDGALTRDVPYQLIDDVDITGADLDGAQVGFDQNNMARVIMNFKPAGAQRFCDITTANVQHQFAIILDERIRSAPNIREPICGGTASIEMASSANSVDEANKLALVLRTGSLTAPVEIGEVRSIGASLGADAIETGVDGALIGGIITLAFMILWYRPKAGLIADGALLLNVLLVFALLAISGATITLPGIAGVALTIGMAVDANIIIYERIREELKLGVSPRKAVDTGYDKGLSAILDANITTAIAGIVLYSYGSGPIKGFAVTLLIGIFTTLVTALYVTRTFMEIVTRRSGARLRL